MWQALEVESLWHAASRWTGDTSATAWAWQTAWYSVAGLWGWPWCRHSREHYSTSSTSSIPRSSWVRDLGYLELRATFRLCYFFLSLCGGICTSLCLSTFVITWLFVVCGTRTTKERTRKQEYIEGLYALLLHQGMMKHKAQGPLVYSCVFFFFPSLSFFVVCTQTIPINLVMCSFPSPTACDMQFFP